jgi:GNAT superfamily N-acetyltransferase
MGSGIRLRTPVDQDIPAIARLHVQSWRETYRELLADSVLDDPEFVPGRERFWTAALTDPRYAANRIAVAELHDSVVGIAMAGPSAEPEVKWDEQLFVLYTSTAVHGLGAGAALLDAVVEPSATVGLWVAEPNPRAQAFYRKSGFRPDGATRFADGMDERRWVRALT